MAKALARPIKTKRDYHGAASAAKQTVERNGQEPAVERRLQALLDEMEKFDDAQVEDNDSGDGADEIEGLPRRRWSDESSDAQ